MDVDLHSRGNHTGYRNTHKMNAETIIQEIELATWAMAEAESLEKRAHKLRVDATRTLAKVRLEMVDALEEAKQKRNAIAVMPPTQGSNEETK